MACGVHWALSLVTSGVEHLFLCLLAIHVSSFTDVSKSQGHILFRCLYFYYGAVRVLYKHQHELFVVYVLFLFSVASLFIVLMVS